MQIVMQGAKKAVFDAFTLVERRMYEGQQKAGDYSICGFRIISHAEEFRLMETRWF